MKLARSQIAVLLFLALVLGTVNKALADNCTATGGGSCSGTCTGPAGNAGEMFYNLDNHLMQFCNGCEWVPMGPAGASSGNCANPTAPEGAKVYNATWNVIQYCDGADWISTGTADTGIPGGSCASPTGVEGHMIYNDDEGMMQFCNGTDWIAMSEFAPSGGGGGPGKCVFVTSTTFKGGGVAGLAGADTQCQTHADNATPPLLGTYKAWLSDSGTNATDRLTHSATPYVQVDGSTVANDWADLIDGEINFRMVERDIIPNSADLDDSMGVAVSDDGNTVFVATQMAGAMAVVDVTDRSAISYTTKITGISGADAIDVEGSYAYVIGTNVLQIVDVSTPATPVFPSGGNSGALTITGAYDVVVDAVAGFAYVATDTTNSVVVVNIATKNTPTITTTVTHATDLNGAHGIALSTDKKSLFVVAQDANKFTVIDVDPPASAAVVASIANSASAPIDNALLLPVEVAVAGNYAYTINSPTGYSVVGVIDVTAPAAPVFKGNYQDSTILVNNLDFGGIAASGTNVFLTSRGTQTVLYVDASDPTAPALVTKIRNYGGSYGNMNSPAVYGNFVFVPHFISAVFDLSSFEFNPSSDFSAISLDEDGVSRAGDGVWTGTTTAALYTGGSTACSTVWSSSGGGSDGTSGIAGDGTASWTQDAIDTACTVANHLYCFEQ